MGIRSLCKNGNLEETLKVVDCLERQGSSIPRDIVYSLLQGCIKRKDLACARKVHRLMRKHGLSSVPALADHLIRLFSTCGSLNEANEAFSDVSKPSVFTWNSLISAHSKLGGGVKALQLYEKMQKDGVVPDRVTFVCLCKACGCVRALNEGFLLHDQAIRHAYEADVIMGNTLIDMYAKCGCLVDARKLFELHVERDMVTWIVMISGYAAQGHGLPALELYTRMQYHGVKPSRILMLCAIKACVCIGALNQGQLIHNEIMEDELESDMVIMSSLVDMYAKCRCLSEARNVFNELSTCDVVAWSLMIDGYAENDHATDALEVFQKMLLVGPEPNEATFVGVLKACCVASAIEAGKLAHSYITEIGKELETSVIIGTALVDMYAKCKSLENAYSVFMGLSIRNLVSWGAVISGFAEAGQGFVAIGLFNEMVLTDIAPNAIILSSVLKACSSIYALEQGIVIHVLVFELGFESDQAIGNKLVDLYAKMGDLATAHTIFNSLLHPDVVSFGALIAGYSYQGFSSLALELYDKMLKRGILPEQATFLILLKACSSIGAIGHGKLIHDHIVNRGLESNILVRNALVDMYVKTGNIEEARQVLSHASGYDVVVCDSMIGGFAQRGDFRNVVYVLEDMHQVGVELDSAMLASILAACSSGGLLNEGHAFLTSIKERSDIISSKEHYSSVVDLLGRSGKIQVAEDISITMPMPPDAITWTSLLTSCKTYSNEECGSNFFV